MKNLLRLTLALALIALLSACDTTRLFDFLNSPVEAGYRPDREPFFRDRRGRVAPDGRGGAEAEPERRESRSEPRSTPEPTPKPKPRSTPELTPTPRPEPTPSFLPTPALKSTPKPTPGPNQVLYGIPVPGKPGYVTSPYSPDSGYIDVTGLAPGTKAEDPYTKRVFMVP